MKKRLFAIGDIHGCFDSLKNLIENKIKLKRSDKLILLGDYIDRGTQSKDVIDFIIELQSKGFDIVPLMGNHEAMLIDALENEENLSKWFYNRGGKTLMSFGVESLTHIDQQYISFFKGLNLYYEFDNFLFVHAGFNDLIDNPFNDKYLMLWSRNTFYKHPLLIDKIIVHGHTPITKNQCHELVTTRNQTINIDTGCVYTDYEGLGYLTALELFSYELFSV
jgi:serine/threonine protein phosphatase 1